MTERQGLNLAHRPGPVGSSALDLTVPQDAAAAWLRITDLDGQFLLTPTRKHGKCSLSPILTDYKITVFLWIHKRCLYLKVE